RVAGAEIERLIRERVEVEKAAVDAETALAEAGAQKHAIEEEVQSRNQRSEELRIEMENLRKELAGLQSQMAVIQERRSAVAREVAALGQQVAELERRAAQADAQIDQAGVQQEQTLVTIESLAVTRAGLIEERDVLDGAIGETTAALDDLRRE